jgi:hypothetical protein
VDRTFRIPGTEGPDVTVRTPTFGAIKVLVNEVPLRRTSRRKLLFEVPLRDGTTTELRIKNNFSGMTAEVNGTVIPLQRRLARWELVLVLAPFVLIAVGGLIGGIFAALAAGINTQVARRDRIGTGPGDGPDRGDRRGGRAVRRDGPRDRSDPQAARWQLCQRDR